MPYQLHCWTPVIELTVELATELLATEVFELDTAELIATELFELATLLATELDVTAPEHTAPVITGFSATLPFLSPCTPKLTDWPG